MRSPLLLWIAPCLLATLSACAAFKSHKPEAKPAKEAPQLIGQIASIPADKRFVLIQSYGRWNVDAGTVLTSRGPDNRSANLLATGEVLGQFAAADLQSGTLDVGDAVYSHHVPQAASAPNTPQQSPKEASPAPDKILKNN